MAQTDRWLLLRTNEHQAQYWHQGAFTWSQFRVSYVSLQRWLGTSSEMNTPIAARHCCAFAARFLSHSSAILSMNIISIYKKRNECYPSIRCSVHFSGSVVQYGNVTGSKVSKHASSSIDNKLKDHIHNCLHLYNVLLPLHRDKMMEHGISGISMWRTELSVVPTSVVVC